MRLADPAAILVLLLSLAAAQEPADKEVYYQDWRWTNFDTHDGLPSDIVLEVLETDHGGALWPSYELGLDLLLGGRP